MSNTPTNNEYTPSIVDVIESEKDYIKQRRAAVEECTKEKCIEEKDAKEQESTKEQEDSKEKDSGLELPKEIDNTLWGIALSGGGIRSATFALGVIQGLTCRSKKFSKGLFRRFDYMSTVSGGGYIGACLSSLLADDETAGVDHDNSPFVGLHSDANDTASDDTKNSVRHQLHHLRARGNYLAGSRKLLSFEFQRFGGTAVFGTLHNFILFSILFIAVVALLHFGLTTFGGGSVDSISPRISYTCNSQVIDSVRPISDSVRKSLGKFGYTMYSDTDFSVTSWESLKSGAEEFYSIAIEEPIGKLWCAAVTCQRKEGYRWMYCLAAIFGALWTLSFITIGVCWRAKVYEKQAKNPPETIDSGLSLLEKYQNKFIYMFNWGSALLLTVGTIIMACIFTSKGIESVAAIFLPFAFALGSGAAALFASAIETCMGETYRIRRSFLAAIKGGTFLGILLSLTIPHALVMAFSVSHISFMGFASVVFFLISAALFGKGKSISAGIPSGFWAKNFKLLLNTGMVLTILLSITPVTHLLVRHLYPLFQIDGLPWQMIPLFWAGILGAVVCIMSLIDANRLSPFNFYRDRLTEAYLQTFAHVNRSKADDKQGKAMKLVSNRERMYLTHLGRKNTKGPYHLFTASMNVSGSNELLRKDTKSEHFLFSPKYVGSKSTGYIATGIYHGKKLRLSRAMTVAGAAASSGMGIYSFAAQAFFTTLFNLRLGQWMNNPWWYRPRKPLKRTALISVKLWLRKLARVVFGKRKTFYKGMLSSTKPIFWLSYLLREISGMTNAETRRVLLSDGGHTGDNLGLLPLLQRRCAVIVVSDADKDDNYTFDSFNNAARMANIEDNITIDIDLTPITLSTESKEMQSKQSVALGLIHYPALQGQHCGKTGLLVYLKASVSALNPKELEDPKWTTLLHSLTHCMDKSALPFLAEIDWNQCTDEDWHIPAHVENYNRKNPDFPHDSTADQFYDSEQFEAYRALGEHVARQAVRILEQIAVPPKK